jgi:hypothetical protein
MHDVFGRFLLGVYERAVVLSASIGSKDCGFWVSYLIWKSVFCCEPLITKYTSQLGPKLAKRLALTGNARTDWTSSY